MQVLVTPDVSPPCVPVSTSETRVSKRETKAEHNSPWMLNERVYSISEAINVLIEAGFTIGVDGELLPPHCMVSQLRGMSA